MLASALWTQWSWDPSTGLTAILALLWWQGGRGVSADRTLRRTAAFWGSVATLVLALNSPLDAQADQLLWAHMVQHVLLLTVVAPLLVLSRPMPRVLRALPRALRIRAVREVRRGRAGAPARWIVRPLVAWICFAASIVAWHIPGLYDLALRHQGIHDFEHFTYITTGILFWNHALAVPPFASVLSWPRRAAYIVGGMVVGWALSLVLAFAPHPLYPFYLGRTGAISALTDQRLAAGVMWVPGSITFFVALVIAIMRWLEPARRATVPARPNILA
jgi:putative membrane protein